MSYSRLPRPVRAEPKIATAGPSSASRPKPSTNSAWIRSTRQGSVCTQSVGPALSSSRWSVVPDWVNRRRRITGPRCRSGGGPGLFASVIPRRYLAAARREGARNGTRRFAWLGSQDPREKDHPHGGVARSREADSDPDPKTSLSVLLDRRLGSST